MTSQWHQLSLQHLQKCTEEISFITTTFPIYLFTLVEQYILHLIQGTE